MKRTLRITWCIGAVAAIIIYIFHGFAFSLKPQALSWSEFSSNPQAVAHFAERNGITLDGSAAQMSQLEKAFDAEVTRNRDFDAGDGVGPRGVQPARGWLARVQNIMSTLYQMWIPRRDPAGRHVHYLFHFSPATQLRWTIGLTLGLLIAIAASTTSGINWLERKARA